MKIFAPRLQQETRFIYFSPQSNRPIDSVEHGGEMIDFTKELSTLSRDIEEQDVTPGKIYRVETRNHSSAVNIRKASGAFEAKTYPGQPIQATGQVELIKIKGKWVPCLAVGYGGDVEGGKPEAYGFIAKGHVLDPDNHTVLGSGRSERVSGSAESYGGFRVGQSIKLNPAVGWSTLASYSSKSLSSRSRKAGDVKAGQPYEILDIDYSGGKPRFQIQTRSGERWVYVNKRGGKLLWVHASGSARNEDETPMPLPADDVTPAPRPVEQTPERLTQRQKNVVASLKRWSGNSNIEWEKPFQAAGLTFDFKGEATAGGTYQYAADYQGKATVWLTIGSDIATSEPQFWLYLSGEQTGRPIGKYNPAALQGELARLVGGTPAPSQPEPQPSRPDDAPDVVPPTSAWKPVDGYPGVTSRTETVGDERYTYYKVDGKVYGLRADGNFQRWNPTTKKYEGVFELSQAGKMVPVEKPDMPAPPETTPRQEVPQLLKDAGINKLGPGISIIGDVVIKDQDPNFTLKAGDKIFKDIYVQEGELYTTADPFNPHVPFEIKDGVLVYTGKLEDVVDLPEVTIDVPSPKLEAVLKRVGLKLEDLPEFVQSDLSGEGVVDALQKDHQVTVDGRTYIINEGAEVPVFFTEGGRLHVQYTLDGKVMFELPGGGFDEYGLPNNAIVTGEVLWMNPRLIKVTADQEGVDADTYFDKDLNEVTITDGEFTIDGVTYILKDDGTVEKKEGPDERSLALEKFRTALNEFGNFGNVELAFNDKKNIHVNIAGYQFVGRLYENTGNPDTGASGERFGQFNASPGVTLVMSIVGDKVVYELDEHVRDTDRHAYEELEESNPAAIAGLGSFDADASVWSFEDPKDIAKALKVLEKYWEEETDLPDLEPVNVPKFERISVSSAGLIDEEGVMHAPIESPDVLKALEEREFKLKFNKKTKVLRIPNEDGRDIDIELGNGWEQKVREALKLPYPLVNGGLEFVPLNTLPASHVDIRDFLATKEFRETLNNKPNGEIYRDFFDRNGSEWFREYARDWNNVFYREAPDELIGSDDEQETKHADNQWWNSLLAESQGNRYGNLNREGSKVDLVEVNKEALKTDEGVTLYASVEREGEETILFDENGIALVRRDDGVYEYRPDGTKLEGCFILNGQAIEECDTNRQSLKRFKGVFEGVISAVYTATEDGKSYTIEGNGEAVVATIALDKDGKFGIKVAEENDVHSIPAFLDRIEQSLDLGTGVMANRLHTVALAGWKPEIVDGRQQITVAGETLVAKKDNDKTFAEGDDAERFWFDHPNNEHLNVALGKAEGEIYVHDTTEAGSEEKKASPAEVEQFVREMAKETEPPSTLTEVMPLVNGDLTLTALKIDKEVKKLIGELNVTFDVKSADRVDVMIDGEYSGHSFSYNNPSRVMQEAVNARMKEKLKEKKEAMDKPGLTVRENAPKEGFSRVRATEGTTWEAAVLAVNPHLKDQALADFIEEMKGYELDGKTNTSEELKPGDWVTIRVEKGDDAPSATVEIPDGVERIALSDAGREWYAKHKKVVDEGLLVDGTKFWSPELKADMNLLLKTHLVTAEGGVQTPLVFTEVSPAENGYEYKCVIEGVEWYVAEMPWYEDQFSEGTEDKELVFYKKDDRLAQAVVQIKHTAGKIDFDPQLAYDRTQEALKVRSGDEESEDARPEVIKSYELPKDRPIGYIGIVDSSDDIIVRGTRPDTMHFAGRMNEAGYTVVTPEGYDAIEHIEGSESPKDAITRRLDALKAAGVTDVFLEPSGHGLNEEGTDNNGKEYPDGVYFEVGTGGKYGHGHYQVLTDADLHDILRSYPEMNFTIKTPACSGGGLAEMMDSGKYEEPDNARVNEGGRPRVVMVLQSKAFGTNQEGRLKQGDNPREYPIFSAYYDVFLADALFEQGMDFGAAHLYADTKAKELIPCDAELWYSEGDGVLVTKGIKVTRGMDSPEGDPSGSEKDREGAVDDL